MGVLGLGKLLTIVSYSTNTRYFVDYPGLNLSEECKIERVHVYSVISPSANVVCLLTSYQLS